MDQPSLEKLLNDIKAQIAAGNRIEAITLYRQATGAGLAEAKQAVELIASGKPPPDADGAKSLSDDGLRQVKERIAAGNPIEAIKLYRQAAGVDLKSAKEAVDAITDTMLHSGEISPAVALARQRAGTRLMLLVAIGLAVAMGIAAVVVGLVMAH